MSVKEFREDLKHMTLDEALAKHNMCLKDLFNCHQNKTLEKRVKCNVPNIFEVHEGCFTIQKTKNHVKEHYGTYHSLNDAVRVRDELEKCDWDKKQLLSILSKLGINHKHLTGNY